MKTLAIILAVAVTTVQGYGFARTRVVSQYGSGGRRGGGGRGWGWGAGQKQPVSGGRGYYGGSGRGYMPQRPIINPAPVSGGGYGVASAPLMPVVPTYGGPKPSISRPSGPVSGFLSGGGRVPTPAPASLRPAPIKPIAPTPTVGGSGWSDRTGGGQGYGANSYY